jgi:peptidyl-Lys metalloendopeptidase
MSSIRSRRWILLGFALSLLAGGCGGLDGSPGSSEGVTSFSPLSVTLSASAQAVSEKEELEVTVTFVNNSADTVRLLRWKIPEEEHSPMLTVEQEGKAVDYLGRIYKRPAPQADDYITFSPGYSISQRIIITQEFDFSAGGTYQIRYFAYTESGELSSDPIVVEVEARPIQDREEQRSMSSSECSSSQISELEWAFVYAYLYTEDSIDHIWNERVTERTTTWFGSDPNLLYIINTYWKIKSAMEDKDINFKCDCTSSAYAYVIKNKPYIVHPCNAFWSAPYIGTDSKAGTIIHELSHFDAIASTDDWAYGHTACMNLAKNDPDKARDNADSYEYFAENNPALP